MKFYLEITLLPNEEVDIHFLWAKLYAQLHLAFVEAATGQGGQTVGMSFPRYQADAQMRFLGHKSRLCAPNTSDLEKLNLAQWLERLADYVHLSSIKPVPETIKGYAVFSRYRPRFNIDKVAERFAQHKNIGFESALAHCKTYKTPAKMLPFIQLKSQTNGQEFRLAIQQKVVEQGQAGVFNTYGLSQNATVPIF